MPIEINGSKSTKKVSGSGYKNDWIAQNTTYSGTDAVLCANLKTSSGKVISQVIGEAQTFSYSMYEKPMPVHAIGNMNAKDYVHGVRTFAGSMNVIIFKQHWIYNLLEKFAAEEGYSSNHYLINEFAPIDFTLFFSNEYGSQSSLAVYGARFFNEGVVIGVNDIYIEGTYQFVAMDIRYMADANYGTDLEETTTAGKKSTTTSVPTKTVNDGGKKSDGTSSSTTTTNDNTTAATFDKDTYKATLSNYNKLSEVQKALKEEKTKQLQEIAANNAAGKYSSTKEFTEAKSNVDALYKKKLEAAKEYFKEKEKSK
jgi:hypothetical protein